jgi:3-hydroxyisobutyrate dehydrogenase-like beta-hydroxyacid dehydrogenase
MTPKKSNDDTATNFRIVVVGLGAMGGGMARALLDSRTTSSIVGYDVHKPSLEAFYQEAKAAGKVGGRETPPESMKDAILDHGIDFVLLSLVNENQCETVCFGGVGNGDRTEDCLIQLMPKGSCVILTSTVTGMFHEEHPFPISKQKCLSVLSLPIFSQPLGQNVPVKGFEKRNFCSLTAR